MAGCSFHQGSPIAEWKRWENVKGVYNLCIYNIRIHKDRKKMGEETLRQSLTSWFPVFEGAPFNEAAVYFWSIAWRCFPDLYSKMQQVKLSLRGIIRHQPSEDFVKTWWKNVKCLVGIGSKAHTESCGGGVASESPDEASLAPGRKKRWCLWKHWKLAVYAW